jgi:hypothetical protein
MKDRLETSMIRSELRSSANFNQNWVRAFDQGIEGNVLPKEITSNDVRLIEIGRIDLATCS